MIILLTGATGFIGTQLTLGLRRAGHVVITTRRHPPPGSQELQADFARDHDPHLWLPRLRGINAVLNAVGLIRESAGQTFDAVHTRAPQALFAACAQAGVQRVVQISALGADAGTTAYFTSKRRADEFLASLALDWTIVQPALVYGPRGVSAGLFTMLASLPLIPVPGRGTQRLQPIHIDDLVEAIVNLFGREPLPRQYVPLAGPGAISLRDFIADLRSAMHLGKARFINIPTTLMNWAALLGEKSGRGLLDRDTLAMLQAGNTADPAMTHRLLRRPPRMPQQFITDAERTGVALNAILRWLLPVLRLSIALMWLWTGIVSLGLYPRDASYELLARTGVPDDIAPVLLYGAAVLDIILGVAILVVSRRRWLWLTQMVLIVVYTSIITFRLPEFWLHPYGPILKNLPLLASLYLLYVIDRPHRPWNT